MKSSRIVICLVSCLTILSIACVQSAGAVILVKNGFSSHKIVLGRDASLTERHAALELQTFLEMISGCFMPVVEEENHTAGPAIFVGQSDALRRIDGSIKFEELGDEGFVIKTAGEHLLLAGGRLRGSLYAVYAFLEEVLGCRWYTPECSHIPKRPTIEIAALNIAQKPAFLQRDVHWEIARDADWSARNRVTSAASRLDEQRGGRIILNGVHTFSNLIQQDVYWDIHPEYYAIKSSRRREWKRAQLCLSNPEIVKLLAHHTLNWIKREPGSLAYFVAQNDGYGECYCGHCEADYKKEGSPSALYVRCVNKVSRETTKYFPDTYIGTLAYRFTEKPPLFTRPERNVVIRLCNIQGCDAHPLTECDRNADFVKNLQGWTSITENVFIWDYLTNFHNYLQPHPNWYAMYKDIRYFREIGVKGIFLQTCSETEGAANEDMSAWVQAKLLWDPDRDLDELMDEFLGAYYGSAAGSMKKFYRLFLDKVLDEWVHFNLYFPPAAEYLSPGMINKAERLLDEAALLTKNEAEAAYRVEEARLGIRYVKLVRPRQHTLENDMLLVSPLTPPGTDLRELEDFMETCKKHGVTTFTEGRETWIRYNEMRANVSEHRLISLENPEIRVEVVPSFGGAVYRIIHKRTGKNVLELTPPEREGYPAIGGYQEYPVLTEIFDYTIEENSSGSRIILEGILPYNRIKEAFRFTREIKVPAHGAVVEIASRMEAIADVADFHRPRYIQPKMNLSIGPQWQLLAGFRGQDGLYKLLPLPEPVQGLLIRAERAYPAARDFYTNTLTSGDWILFNPAGQIGIRSRFDKSEVEYCTLDADRRTPEMVSMAMASFRSPMEKGEVITLRHTLEIVEAIPGVPAGQ